MLCTIQTCTSTYEIFIRNRFPLIPDLDLLDVSDPKNALVDVLTTDVFYITEYSISEVMGTLSTLLWSKWRVDNLHSRYKATSFSILTSMFFSLKIPMLS